MPGGPPTPPNLQTRIFPWWVALFLAVTALKRAESPHGVGATGESAYLIFLLVDDENRKMSPACQNVRTDERFYFYTGLYPQGHTRLYPP